MLHVFLLFQVRLSVQTLHLTEESALCVARLPASDSYSHCRGFTYEVYDDDDPGLPGFTDLVSRISTCWPSLSDLAITVGRPSDVTSAIRSVQETSRLGLNVVCNSIAGVQLPLCLSFA